MEIINTFIRLTRDEDRKREMSDKRYAVGVTKKILSSVSTIRDES